MRRELDGRLQVAEDNSRVSSRVASRRVAQWTQLNPHSFKRRPRRDSNGGVQEIIERIKLHSRFLLSFIFEFEF